MMTIGSKMILKYGLALAPMAGFTDKAFRKLCLRHGAEYVTTEMVSAQALVHHDEKTNILASLDKEESNCSIQLFGSDPATMGEATAILLSSLKEKNQPLPWAIDINMGCPVKKIVSNGEGSSLMKTPEKCFDILRAVKESSLPYGIGVTAKIRAGFDADHLNAPEVAVALFEAGADLIAVHGRTREEMYRPGIHYDVIAKVVDVLPKNFPVFGNGDIVTVSDAEKMKQETGVPGIMIGRGALGNPWIFSQIIAHMEGQSSAPPSLQIRVATAEALMEEILSNSSNEYAAICECRGRIAHFLTGIRGGASIRNALNKATTFDEAKKALSMALL